MINDHEWGQVLDIPKAKKLVEEFIQNECSGIVPQKVIFVLPYDEHDTKTWSNFALNLLGFKGFITLDSR
jgi:hypothetical protein